MFRKIFRILLISFFSQTLWVLPAQALTIPTGFSSWEMKTTTDTLKAWTIKLSGSIDGTTVKNTNIYVTDDSNKPVSTTLSLLEDEFSIRITPTTAYTPGTKYWIFITDNLKSKDGKKNLKQRTTIPFTVTAPTNSIITSVSSSFSSLLTSFSVTTSPDVYSVKINQTNMIYEGSNTFSLGMVGLKQGSKVMVYAYDSKGTLLKSQSYTVE